MGCCGWSLRLGGTEGPEWACFYFTNLDVSNGKWWFKIHLERSSLELGYRKQDGVNCNNY